MATDAGNVNGVYDQYSQPAELAASTPSQNASASQTSNTASSSKADPQEIGWYFVEQYYTNLSKSPEKIHLFYNKKSQLITGKEAEKVLPAVGAKAIHEKIKSFGFSDCKIRVINVDSQSSYDNIVVQVIGEISNKSEPHHKFVQTFVLATQPNGYFVLNDICRYLSEDVDEIVEDEAVQEALAIEETKEPVTEPEVVPEPPSVEADTVDTGTVAEQPEGDSEVIGEEPEPSQEDVVGKEEAADTTTSEINAPEPEPEPEPEPAAQEQATPEEASLAPEVTQSQTLQPAPAADGPPVKKTWADMVGTKARAIPALPQTTAPTTAPTQPKPQKPAPAQTPKPTPTEPAADTASGSAATPTSQQSNGWQEAGKKTRNQQPKPQEGIVHAYIKNVNDKIDARVLREVLEKYGSLKYYDVSRPKQCAFVEFSDPSAYAAAVADNPHTVGTEQINVEERRPRPATTGGFNGQYPSRGGANAGRGRGGAQQRSGSQGGGFSRDASRGNFPQRGSKPGTPSRGRGQAPAS